MKLIYSLLFTLFSLQTLFANDNPALTTHQIYVGQGEKFTTIKDAVEHIRKLYKDEHFILTLKGEKFTEPVHIQFLQFTNGSLTINAENGAIINPTNSTKPALYILKCNNITIDGITLVDAPADGINFTHCKNVTLENSTIKNTQLRGIIVDNHSWSSETTNGMTDQNITIRNNQVHGFNLAKKKWYHAGIQVPASYVKIIGNTVTGKGMEDMGISIYGRHNTVRNNFVYVENIRDAGGIYTGGRNYHFGHNTIADNTVITSAIGIYIDDINSYNTVENNRLIGLHDLADPKKGFSSAIVVGGGRENNIQNNNAIGFPTFVGMDNRGMGWDGVDDEANKKKLNHKMGKKAIKWGKTMEKLLGEDLGITSTMVKPEQNKVINNGTNLPEDQWLKFTDMKRGGNETQQMPTWNTFEYLVISKKEKMNLEVLKP